MPGLFPILGETVEEAEQNYQEIQDLILPHVGLNILSPYVGNIDLSQYPLDKKFSELDLTVGDGVQSRFEVIHKEAIAKDLTLEEVYKKVAGSRGHHIFVGTPNQLADKMEKWFNSNVASDWMEGRQKMMTLLQEEAELEEIVKMVGMDALSPGDRLKMEAARSIREDFLHQNSFHEIDTYTSLKKQHMMMLLVNAFYDRAVKALSEGASLQKLISMPVREQIGRFKYVHEDALDEEYKKVDEELTAQIADAFVKEGR